MRERAPIWYHEPTDHWLVSRFADVNALLRDRRFGRTYHHVATHAEMGRPEAPDWHGPFWHLIRSGILDMEPPDHTRVRALVSKAFTPRMVEGMRDRIQGMMDGLVDGVEGGGEFDLISTLAEPLPVAVIAELLGIPDEDRAPAAPVVGRHLRHVRAASVRGDGRTAVRACVEFSEYLRTLSRERRADPRDDLISALGAGPGRRGTPHRGRADRHLRPAAERGPRGHRERHRQRLVVAVPQPGPARPPPRRRRPWCHGRSRS